MKQGVKNLIDKLDKYAENFKDEMRWEPSICKMICSFMCVITNIEPDVEKYKDMKQFIIDNTGAFSFFRGEISPYIATMLMGVDDQEFTFDKFDYTYQLLRSKKFTGSEQLVCTSVLLADNINKADLDIIVEHFKDIYYVFGKLHPMNTCIDNYLGLATIACSDFTLDEIPRHMRILEAELKSTVGGGNILQTLVNALFMVKGDPMELAKRARISYMTFKSNKYDFRWYGNIAMMGLLTSVDGDMTNIVYDVLEAAKYAETLPNFSNLMMDTFDRLMIMIAVIIYDFCKYKLRSRNAMRDKTYYGDIISTMVLVLIVGLFAEEDLTRL